MEVVEPDEHGTVATQLAEQFAGHCEDVGRPVLAAGLQSAGELVERRERRRIFVPPVALQLVDQVHERRERDRVAARMDAAAEE